VQGLLALCPQLSLTSDIICGFPGETDQDHQETLALLRRVPYDNLFSFIYSRRPHTTAEKMLEKNEASTAPAAEWTEVPRETALARLEEVQALQMARTLERRSARLGAEVEVLVESGRPGDRGEPLLFGRSRENWTVHFTGDARVGDVVRVRVDKVTLGSITGAQTSIVDAATVAVPSAPAADSGTAPKRRLSVLQA
jgi:tRNA-2-methylthio-N6-dimethylallyladenosine synthase